MAVGEGVEPPRGSWQCTKFSGQPWSGRPVLLDGTALCSVFPGFPAPETRGYVCQISSSYSIATQYLELKKNFRKKSKSAVV